MDTSTLLNIVSIVISIAFAIVGFHFSNKSDKTLASIQTRIDAQHDKFMTMLQDERKTHDEFTANTVQQMIQLVLNSKGDLSKDKSENIEKELQKIALRLVSSNQSNSAPVLSKQGKVGEKKAHA